MTYLEAILEDLRPYPIRKSLIERKCIKHNLQATDSATDEKNVALIVIEILVQMISLNNVSEGGVSLSFDKEAVQRYIKSLCLQYGFDSNEYIEEPSVTYLGDV